MGEFAERLQKLRESKKPVRSRRVTSELCGLPSDAIRRYERGEAEPSLSSLRRIADYFEVTLDELVGREKTGD